MPTFPTPDPITRHRRPDRRRADHRQRPHRHRRRRSDPAIRPRRPTSGPPSRRSSSTPTATADHGRPGTGGTTRPSAAAESIDVTIELPTGSQRHRRLGAGRLLRRGRARRVPAQDRRWATSASTRPARSAPRRPTATSPSTASPADAELTTGSGDIRVEEIDGDGGDQELQRRHHRRRGDRRPAGEGVERRRHRAAGHTPRWWPRRPTATCASPRSAGAWSCSRPRPASSRSASGAGTAAWLDVVTRFGMRAQHPRQRRRARDGRRPVEVRARTSVGDILIGRAHTDDPTAHLTDGDDAA